MYYSKRKMKSQLKQIGLINYTGKNEKKRERIARKNAQRIRKVFGDWLKIHEEEKENENNNAL